MKAHRFIIAALSAFGLFGFQAAAQAQAQRQVVAVQNGTQHNPKEVQAIRGGDFSGASLLAATRSGLTPKEWGMSNACRKMVRKNRMMRAGISAQRI